MFQFPSSGKLLSNAIMVSLLATAAIGFNSLQAGNFFQTCKKYWRNVRGIRFNSLQAGNFFQTRIPGRDVKYKWSFNSLQAGNFFQTWQFWFWLGIGIAVSIPFKRETSFKRGPKWVLPGTHDKFQFPSSGKLLSNKKIRLWNLMGIVTLQFPSSGKLLSNKKIRLWNLMGIVTFQFPSSGKLLSNPYFSDPVWPWLHTPKTKHELRDAFFRQK